LAKVKVTKSSIIRCKKIKGGQAACWLRDKGKTVFRFVKPSVLEGLGIPIVGMKIIPGFAGKSRSRSGKASMKPGCRKYRNGRIACPTSKGWRIIG